MPFASSFQRYADCPGSFTLSKAAPPEPPSPGASRGTRVHGGLSGEIKLAELSPDELQTVEELRTQEEILLDQFTREGWKVLSMTQEKRLWEDATESRWSGKADKVFIMRNDEKIKGALVIDYKSTRYAERAEENLQLAALAVLVDCDQSRSMEMVHVALIYPDGYDQAVYDVDALDEAAEKCKALVDSITITHTESRVPSHGACKWCKAKSICPEAKSQLNGLVRVEPKGLVVGDFPQLLERCAIAESLIKDIRAQARGHLESGEYIRGWELKPGHMRSTITNTEEVYNRAAILGIDGKEFSSKVTITKKNLEELVRNKLGQKGNLLDKTVTELTDGCTTDKMTSASLKEVKA
mgnify:CR=1 FL=1